MMKKTIAVVMLTAIPLTACGGGRGTPAAPSPEPATPNAVKEPVELTFYLNSATQEEFERYYKIPLKEKFPHVTLTGTSPGKGTNIEDLIAAGTVPDVFVGSKGSISNQMASNGLVQDIGELIKSTNYDLKRLEPGVVDIMRKAANGQIVGLPLNMNVNALYYNKDLFDKFGVPYPKDGMTWDDIYELAKQLTRNEQGIQYRGFSDRWGDTFFGLNPFGLPYLDPKEEKTTFMHDDWKKIIQNWLRFYTLPGLQFDKNTAFKETDRQVFKTGTSAMTVMAADVSAWKFSWDVVSIPTYREKPGIGLQANARFNFIAKGAKKQQAAFEVIAYMTTDDYQRSIAKSGLFPVLADEAIKKAYMEDEPLYKNKNVKAFYYHKFAPEPQGRAPGLVNTLNVQDKYLLPEMINVLIGAKDVNTALRDADEGALKGLAAELAAKK